MDSFLEQLLGQFNIGDGLRKIELVKKGVFLAGEKHFHNPDKNDRQLVKRTAQTVASHSQGS